MNGTDSKRSSAGAALIVLGGLLMAIGAFLPFAKVEAGELPIPAQTVGGLDTPDGKLFLIVGIGLVIIGAWMWVSGSYGGFRGLGSVVLRRITVILAIVAIVAAGFMLYAAVVDITGIEAESLDAIAEAGAAQTPGVSVEQVRAALDQFNVSINTGIGLYIVLGGAAIALIGGILSLIAKQPEPMLPAAPPPPAPPSPPMGTGP
jgi:hypothetical protein